MPAEPRSVNRVLTFCLGLCLLLLVGFCLFGTRGCQSSTPDSKLVTELRLSQALQDEMRTIRAENGTLRQEKLALQGSLEQVSAHVSELNAQQTRLLAVVKEYEQTKKATGKKLIGAGSVAYVAGLKTPQPILRADSGATSADTAQFTFSSDTLSYRAVVRGLRADSSGVKHPTLQLRELSLPNEAVVVFTWDAKRPGSPVAFSVQNSNPLFQVRGLESYAIPELRPELVKVRGLRRVWVIVKQVAPYAGIAFLTGGVVGISLR